jgi:hypothetical protein
LISLCGYGRLRVRIRGCWLCGVCVLLRTFRTTIAPNLTKTITPYHEDEVGKRTVGIGKVAFQIVCGVKGEQSLAKSGVVWYN